MLIDTSQPASQISPGATWMVRCSWCGYARDSHAATEEEALAELDAIHPPCDGGVATREGPRFQAFAYNCVLHQSALSPCPVCKKVVEVAADGSS